MKKIKIKNLTKTLILFCLVFFLSAFTSNKEINGWTKDNLNGKVKSLIEIYYKVAKGDGNFEKSNIKKVNLIFKKKYDNSGNLIEEMVFNSDSVLNWGYTYVYDDEGNLIESGNFNSKGMSTKEVYKYNLSKAIIERKWYKQDGNLSGKSTYIYDNEDKLIEMNIYKNDGGLEGINYYKYNHKGKLIEQNGYKADGSLRSKIIFNYNNDGNLIEKIWQHSDGSIQSSTTFNFDEFGSKIEKNKFNYHYFSDSISVTKSTHRFDNKGRKIEIKDYNYDGEIDWKETYKYNENNDLIEINSYGPREFFFSKINYEYIFDKENNWIKKVVYENDEPNELIEREIEYFD